MLKINDLKIRSPLFIAEAINKAISSSFIVETINEEPVVFYV